MARAKGRIGRENYPVAIRAGDHDLKADEGAALGGGDSGPAPFELLAASLVACTAITLRMYAERKGWPVEGIEVGVHYIKDADGPARIERTLTLEGPLDGAQRARLADVAERTPVTLAIRGGVPITTILL
ncbi:OsmC family protein [Mycobacterium tuberculosis]